MICNNCEYQNECDWYSCYKRIDNEIYLGIGADSTLGEALLAALHDNPLTECEYFAHKNNN